MGDALSGALCVLAAMAAGASLRAGGARWLWVACAVVVAAWGESPVALVLAAVAGFAGFRCSRAAWSASAHALLATIGFVAWLLPDSNSAFAVVAGGAVAGLGALLFARPNRESVDPQPLHLACAGACAALAYVCGAQPGALAVVPVLALVTLIGVHLALAMDSSAVALFASLLSGAASCGLAISALMTVMHGALVVAAVMLAIGCAQPAALLRIARETT
jgi:hypothetical protein